MNVPVITPATVASMRRQGQPFYLIDVRTPAEFNELHVEGAENVPLDRLDPGEFVGRQDGKGPTPIYLICRSGSRGKQACQRLLQAGCQTVANVEGGTPACVDAGLPIVRGKKAMSLERQVRIAAGAIIVLGAALGWLVHPAFWAVCALVGAGLVFAGITDTCGMATVLARMPWNQSRDSSHACGLR